MEQTVSRGSGLEANIEALKEGKTEEECSKSLQWVKKVFAAMIRKREQIHQVYFAEIESTERTRRKGLINAPLGFTRVVSMNAQEMSLKYIDIILEDGPDDIEKVRNMIKDAILEEDTGLYDQAWRFFDTPELDLKTRYIK